MPDILVVDDDVQVCELLQMYLAEEHFQVRAVHDGHAAIAAVKQWVYKPALLNGKPTESDTRIQLNFVKQR